MSAMQNNKTNAFVENQNAFFRTRVTHDCGTFEQKPTHLRRCCKTLPGYKIGLMHSSTLRFQNFLRLAYGQFFARTWFFIQALYIQKRNALILLICLTATVCPAENSTDLNYGMGILNIRSQSIAQSFRLTLPLVIPGDIKPGYQAIAETTWSNIWAQEKSYLLDYEMLDTTLGISYGFNQQLGMAVMFDSRTYFGGKMDGLIQEFHDLLNIDQNGRDDHAHGRAVITRFDPATGALIHENPAHDLNNSGLNLLVNYTFNHDSTSMPGVNLYGVARYPFQTAELINQKKGVDLGVGLGLSKKWLKDFYTYGILGYTLYTGQANSRKLPVVLKDHQFTGLFAMAYTLSENVALLGQYLYSTPVIEGIHGLDKASHEVHLGVKLRMGKKSVVGISIIENIITMDNSPDFAVHFGLIF